MEIRHLEYFAEVARQLNFTKAAASLHVTQPSISKAIKQLEDELGVPLFYRSSRKLELTDAGKAVLVNAKNVLDAFKNMTSELTDIMELKKGEVRIGIPPIIGAAFFSTFISRFKEAHPLVDITLIEVGTNKIKKGVDDGSLDVGLVCNVPVQQDSFEIIELLNDPLMLIVHNSHTLASKKTVEFGELKQERFILYRKDFSLHDRIMEECSRNHFYPNIVCESSQKDFMIEMVEGKLGVALLPAQICKKIHSANITAIPFYQPTVNLELAMVWKKNKYLPFAVREFISVSKESLSPRGVKMPLR
ncbi:LysR family transcriptional regulator [Bacillus marinisedimentorum]|uniref:LysR family transcriptional regulator n=1 Tax=Bacillus marinisedimentorum TaxID=1821260 RepID=UPI0008734213|nr:LysR family transcriptional regulator [Bacillus marinisedimentorum]